VKCLKEHKKVSKFILYLLLYQIFHLHLVILPGKSLMMWSNIVTRNVRRYGSSLLTFEKIGAWCAKGWPPLV